MREVFELYARADAATLDLAEAEARIAPLIERRAAVEAEIAAAEAAVRGVWEELEGVYGRLEMHDIDRETAEAAVTHRTAPFLAAIRGPLPSPSSPLPSAPLTRTDEKPASAAPAALSAAPRSAPAAPAPMVVEVAPPPAPTVSSPEEPVAAASPGPIVEAEAPVAASATEIPGRSRRKGPKPQTSSAEPAPDTAPAAVASPVPATVPAVVAAATAASAEADEIPDFLADPEPVRAVSVAPQVEADMPDFLTGDGDEGAFMQDAADPYADDDEDDEAFRDAPAYIEPEPEGPAVLAEFDTPVSDEDADDGGEMTIEDFEREPRAAAAASAAEEEELPDFLTA